MTSFTFNELNNVVDPYNDDILIRTLFNLSVEGKIYVLSAKKDVIL